MNMYTRNFPKFFPWVIQCSRQEAFELVAFMDSLSNPESIYTVESSLAWTKNFENEAGGDFWLSDTTANCLVTLPPHDKVPEQDFISGMRLKMQRSLELYGTK